MVFTLFGIHICLSNTYNTPQPKSPPINPPPRQNILNYKCESMKNISRFVLETYEKEAPQSEQKITNTYQPCANIEQF